jgi:hypothetical protein
LLENPRHVEAECFGGLEVDHQLELDWGLDGKLARLRALEDEIGIARRAPKIIGLVSGRKRTLVRSLSPMVIL